MQFVTRDGQVQGLSRVVITGGGANYARNPIAEKEVFMTRNNATAFRDWYNDASSGRWQSFNNEIVSRCALSLRPLLEGISQGLPSNRLAVDVGCGGGRYTQLLLDLFDEVHGYDFSERLVQVARKGFPGIKFAIADATALPLDDASADLAMSVGLTECLNKKQLRMYVVEMSRIIAPGGICLFRAWSKYSLGALSHSFGRGVASKQYKLNFYSKGDIAGLLRKLGFEDVHFVGALLMARWWPLIPIVGSRMWLTPLKRLILAIEQRARNLPFFETYWAVARRSDRAVPTSGKLTIS